MPPRHPGKTPFLNLFAFMFAFGWEGPVVLSIGLGNHSTLEILMGLFFTAFFWGVFGLKLLIDLVKHLFKMKSPDDALAASSVAKSEP